MAERKNKNKTKEKYEAFILKKHVNTATCVVLLSAVERAQTSPLNTSVAKANAWTLLLSPVVCPRPERKTILDVKAREELIVAV